MPIVTDTLLNRIGQQIQTHGTAIWYDPERNYHELAHSLTPEQLEAEAVLHYETDRGFLWLRRQLEPYWQDKAPPNLLVYVPLSQADAHQALIEFEVAGVVLRPNQQPPACNTDLAFVAREALAAVFPEAGLAEVVDQVRAGQLSLSELDDLAEKGAEALSGTLSVVFNTGNAAEIALLFLADEVLDEEIKKRQALADLASLLSDFLGVELKAEGDVTALRRQLARQVLVTDFLEAVGAAVPPALQTFETAERPIARQAAVNLAHTWRNRRDLAAHYAYWSKKVAGEIGISNVELGVDTLSRCETFAETEAQLQTGVEEALARRATQRLVALAVERLQGFWANHHPAIKTRWEVIVDAGQVLTESDRLENALKGKSWTAASLLGRYAYGEEGSAPWCNLDTVQRHLERDFHRFELVPGQHVSLLQLVARARQRYAAASEKLAQRFVDAYEADNFELSHTLLQADVYQNAVAPAVQTGRVVYLLIDAFRFEMARELLQILDQNWQQELTVALATPPTITEIGMAALMPGAEKGLSVVSVKGGKLAAAINGKTLQKRQDRVDLFRAAHSGDTAVVKLDKLAPLADNKLTKQLQEAHVVLVTATEEIDGLCETNPAAARRMMDDVFNQARRAIKTLFKLGIEAVVISADHGYLFGEELVSGQAMDPPGGQTVALKRRVWIGQGGAQVPGTVRKPLTAFGIGGELELVTPRNLACFKVAGGSTVYFHGGLSLPELAIPVLTVRAAEMAEAPVEATINWQLTLGGPKITTRFLSVTVQGSTGQLLPLEPPLVRVEVRAGKEAISVPVTATYGLQEATKDVQLQVDPDNPRAILPNTIALQITEAAEVDTVAVHLLDASTGYSLHRVEKVPVDISL